MCLNQLELVRNKKSRKEQNKDPKTISIVQLVLLSNNLFEILSFVYP